MYLWNVTVQLASCAHSAVWVVKSLLDFLKMCNPVQRSNLTMLFQLHMLQDWMTQSDTGLETVISATFATGWKYVTLHQCSPKLFLLADPFWFRQITTELRILAHVHMVSDWLFFFLIERQCVTGPPHYRGFTIAPHSAGFLWTNDQSDAETSTWQHSQETDIHASGATRTRNPSKRMAADPRL